MSVTRLAGRKTLTALWFGSLLLMYAAPVRSSVAPMAMSDWITMMNKLPTPGIGCWSASFPSIAWLPDQCGPAPQHVFTVGNGNDESASSINYAVSTATGSFTSETGYTSEYDSYLGSGTGPDWYTIQLNTLNSSTTFGSNPTYGAEQFIFENQGFPWYTYGYILIEFFLFHYATKYGSCPSGWTSLSAGACTFDTNTKNYGYEDPAYLTKYTLTGSVSSSTDTAKFCDANKGTCGAMTSSDLINLANGNWFGTEFNILGYSATAVFNNGNSGISMGLETNNNENGESCDNTGLSAETNNLNLGTCTGGANQGYITFSQSR